MRCDAFISYSHAADGDLAPAVQTGLHRLAKPWYRLRALRVIRDETDLTANPDLSAAIQEKMDEADWLVILASPQAARSPYVGDEISHWLESKPRDRILLVLSGGDLVWDRQRSDFDPDLSTAAPAPLFKLFDSEPRYHDLRWAHAAQDLSLDNDEFRDAIADLAAPIRGIDKETLISEDRKLHRRARRLATFAVLLLVLLATGVSVAAALAWNNARRAQQATEAADLAEERQRAAEAAEGEAAQREAEANVAAEAADQKRSLAEAAAADAQAARATAQAAQATAETARAKAEAAATEAAQRQTAAEAAQATAEMAQTQAEELRDLAERAQAEAEAARAAAEISQAEAERRRDAAIVEAERLEILAEAAALDAEVASLDAGAKALDGQARVVSAEAARVQAEAADIEFQVLGIAADAAGLAGNSTTLEAKALNAEAEAAAHAADVAARRSEVAAIEAGLRSQLTGLTAQQAAVETFIAALSTFPDQTEAVTAGFETLSATARQVSTLVNAVETLEEDVVASIGDITVTSLTVPQDLVERAIDTAVDDAMTMEITVTLPTGSTVVIPTNEVTDALKSQLKAEVGAISVPDSPIPSTPIDPTPARALDLPLLLALHSLQAIHDAAELSGEQASKIEEFLALLDVEALAATITPAALEEETTAARMDQAPVEAVSALEQLGTLASDVEVPLTQAQALAVDVESLASSILEVPDRPGQLQSEIDGLTVVLAGLDPQALDTSLGLLVAQADAIVTRAAAFTAKHGIGVGVATALGHLEEVAASAGLATASALAADQDVAEAAAAVAESQATVTETQASTKRISTRVDMAPRRIAGVIAHIEKSILRVGEAIDEMKITQQEADGLLDAIGGLARAIGTVIDTARPTLALLGQELETLRVVIDDTASVDLLRNLLSMPTVPARELVDAACAIAQRNLTQDEWETYVGFEPMVVCTMSNDIWQRDPDAWDWLPQLEPQSP